MRSAYANGVPAVIDHDPTRRTRRLSELARRVLRAADLLALRPDDDFSRPLPGHVLLALLLEGRSASALLARESGVDAALVQVALDEGAYLDGVLGVESVLEDAFTHAERLGSHYTGTEHLLLALTHNPSASALLLYAGVEPERLRLLVETHLTL